MATAKIARKNRYDDFGTIERVHHERRQQRQQDCADQPEDAGNHGTAPKLGIHPQIAEQPAGRAQNVWVNLQIRRRPGGFRDEQARAPAKDGEQHHHDGEHCRITASLHRHTAGDRAAEDRQKGGALDQRVASRQFLPSQMIGQDAVFDRPEERTYQAEHEQGYEQ